MKKLLGIIILGLFWCNTSFAISYDWFKTHSKSLTANQLIDHKVYHFIKNNISSKKLYLGMSKGKAATPLIESFMKVLRGPPNDVVYIDDNKYIFTSACRLHSCMEKGVLFIDTEKKHTIGLIRHYFINDSEMSADFLIFSKNHQSFDEIPEAFIQMVKKWITTSHANEPPKTVRFIGSNDKIIDVTKKYAELILLTIK